MSDIGKRHWFLQIPFKIALWYSIGLLDMVNSPFWKDSGEGHPGQETQLVNDSDVLQMQAASGSFSLEAGLPCSSCVWGCAHATSWDFMPGARLYPRSADHAPSLKPPRFPRRQEWPLSSGSILGCLGATCLGVPLLWESCEVPWMAPSGLLPGWICVLHPLLEGNSLSLWVCCGANKLPLFLLTLKCYKKQQSGQVTASWEESHESEHNGRRGNCIYAPGTLPVCVSSEGCTHTQTT